MQVDGSFCFTQPGHSKAFRTVYLQNSRDALIYQGDLSVLMASGGIGVVEMKCASVVLRSPQAFCGLPLIPLRLVP